MAYRYPMMLDVSGRLAVIVGGGAVAARKARALLDAGPVHIRCVATRFCEDLPAGVECVSEAYRAEHLDGATLVFAATDRADVNDAVVRDAQVRNILVSRADLHDAEPGDFTTPAKLECGDLVIAVSAGSPALAAALRDHLRAALDPAWERMASAMRDLRPMIRDSGLPIDVRRGLFRDLASDAALAILRDGGDLDALRRWLCQRHPELTNA